MSVLLSSVTYSFIYLFVMLTTETIWNEKLTVTADGHCNGALPGLAWVIFDVRQIKIQRMDIERLAESKNVLC